MVETKDEPRYPFSFRIRLHSGTLAMLPCRWHPLDLGYIAEWEGQEYWLVTSKDPTDRWMSLAPSPIPPLEKGVSCVG